jgi:DNA invertase Pin-like site-specific DNA recombinase
LRCLHSLGLKNGGKWVSYLRVSTDRQGQSGLGLEAQRKAVLDFLNGGNWKLAEEYVEIESGKWNNRVQLAAALAACKRLKARLVVAELDRLARNAAFSSKLMESGVEFTAADMPFANKLTIHILAAVGARLISFELGPAVRLRAAGFQFLQAFMEIF